MNYSLKVLYSGSTGNATVLCAGETAILIDAGRSARALTDALNSAGVDPDALSAVFLTHEHRDHTAALEVFLKKHPIPVHVAGASAERLLRTASAVLSAALVPHPPLYSVTVGDLTLSSFPTPHDSVASVGYRITAGEHTIGYATDLGTVTPAVEAGLLGCEAVVLECNHDEEMLMAGPYPRELKRRIAARNGHLSNVDCAMFAVKLAQSGMRRLLLAHLSETNNLPELALGEVRAALAGTSVHIKAAAPDAVVEL